MPQLEIALLGPLVVTIDGQPADLAYDKVRALLAYLAVEAERPHRREALAALLWPDAAEGAARKSLRNALATLRQALGDTTAPAPALLITRDTVQLNPHHDIALDVAEVRAALAAAQQHAHPDAGLCPDCAALLERAAQLYSGDFLVQLSIPDSVGFEEWAAVTRERLHRQMLDALARLMTYHEGRGEDEAARQYAWQTLALEAWDEAAHRCLMRVFARSGQRTAALTQYERCRQVLEQELGVEPDAETTTLYEQIRDNRPGAVGALEWRTLPVRRHNLPPQPGPLIGRERELAEVVALIQQPACRLVTLVGPGGIGKTRLGLAAAAEALDAFAQGVFFVSLASLTSAELLVPTIADTLQLPLAGQEDPTAELLAFLRQRDLLLVLDNAEQLLDGVGLLADILQGAPGVKMLVTSRTRLQLYSEWVVELRGLSLPDDAEAPQSEEAGALAFFVQCARRVDPGFVLSADQRASAIKICRMMAGIPLGIELAAAWVRLLDPMEIAQEIERNLEFLTTSLRDIPGRHRSLRAAFDQSWRLLSETERAAFRQLSVFRCGFGREAATRVAGASLTMLSALVDKSLIHRMGPRRYAMHDLLRLYAEEQLSEAGELDQARRRHLGYFLELAGAEPELGDARRSEWLAHAETEYDNLRAALEWALEHREAEAGLRLAHALGQAGMGQPSADSAQIAVLKHGLLSPHPAVVIYALNQLEAQGYPGLASALVELLGHPAPEVRQEALRRIELLDVVAALPAVRQRLQIEAAPPVLGATLRTIAALHDGGLVEVLVPYLEHPDWPVRLGAIVGLLRNGGIEGVIAGGEKLLALAQSGQAGERALAARVIGAVENRGLYRHLRSLLADTDSEVRRAALAAAAEIQHPRLWPIVVEGLATPELWREASAALAAGGQATLPALQSVLLQPDQGRDIQIRIARILGRIGGHRAIALLQDRLGAPEGDVRHQVLRSLRHCGYQAEGAAAPIVERQLAVEIAQAAWTTAALADIGQDDGVALLSAALRQRLDRLRERVLLLLSFISDPSSIQHQQQLAHGLGNNWIEAPKTLDDRLSPKLKPIVLPLFADLPLAERLQQLTAVFPQQALGRAARLREIVAGADRAAAHATNLHPWIAACALYSIARLSARECRGAVVEALSHADPLIRETAAWTLADLDGDHTTSEQPKGGASVITTIEKVLILKAVPIFAQTSDDVLAAVAAILEQVEVAAGQTIFEKGDLGDRMFIIVEGRVQVHDGDRLLNMLGARDVFGEMAVLDAAPRSATVTAVEPTRLFRLDQEPLYELIADHPEVARGIIRVLARYVRNHG